MLITSRSKKVNPVQSVWAELGTLVNFPLVLDMKQHIWHPKTITVLV